MQLCFRLCISQPKRFTTPQGRFVPGLEFAGVVEAIGEGLVKADWMGTRVYGVTRFGGYATYINADSKYLKKTGRISRLVQAVTAYYSIYPLGNLQTDQCVLVHSAAGVGLLAPSILQKRSARVVDTVGNPRKLDFLRSHHPDPNATFILRNPALNFEARVREALASLLSNEGENEEFLKAPEFDIILDSVMGDWPHDIVRVRSVYSTGESTPRMGSLGVAPDRVVIMGFNLIHIYDRANELNRISSSSSRSASGWTHVSVRAAA
ncbi:hypothetical protein BC937DRAFT_90878 [Endogone sp. FLAS-F59071]|nr:hypothetical protein BC937DRAFT_90878 [Endogone sp. FLAS-F59071]|eukprot:RUS21963.1 hypothetical protein BC937DRAFT_90878 [Endogone sp. FLAS-F59071]